MHVPAVDVGERQRGRLRGDNVVHADEGRAAVEAALRTALVRVVARPHGSCEQPLRHGWGERSASSLSFGERPAARRAKPFVDLPRDSVGASAERDREEEP